MNSEKQLKWCQVCQRRKMDMSLGLLCSLTGAKADFEGECADYVIDEKEVEFKVEQYKRHKNDDVGFSWKPVFLSLTAGYVVAILVVAVVVTAMLIWGFFCLLLYFDGF